MNEEKGYLGEFLNTYNCGMKVFESEEAFRKGSKRVFESYEDNYLGLLPQDKDIKVLDIGCGWGHFLYFLKERGYKNLEGIDVGGEQVLTCKGLGLNAIHVDDTVQFLSTRAGAYDLIILNFVIEHVPKAEILGLLRAVRNALKTDGQVLMATENMAKLTGLWSRYSDITHVVGYAERSLNHLLYTAGFKDTKVYGLGPKLHFRLKNICYVTAQGIWQAILGLIYLIEMGSDRPRILSKDLICTGKK